MKGSTGSSFCRACPVHKMCQKCNAWVFFFESNYETYQGDFAKVISALRKEQWTAPFLEQHTHSLLSEKQQKLDFQGKCQWIPAVAILLPYFPVFGLNTGKSRIAYALNKIPYIVVKGLHEYGASVFPCSRVWWIRQNTAVYCQVRVLVYYSDSGNIPYAYSRIHRKFSQILVYSLYSRISIRRTNHKADISIRRTVNLGTERFPGQTLIRKSLESGHL